jgi:hypothetical protein
LHKPSEPYSLEAHLDFSAAKVVSGKPPHTRRHFLGPQRRAWAAEANDLYDQTLPPNPQPRDEQPPPKPPERTPAPVATDTPNRTVATPQRPAQRAPGPFARGDKPPLHAETSKPPQRPHLSDLFMRPVSAPARPAPQRLPRGSPTCGPAP